MLKRRRQDSDLSPQDQQQQQQQNDLTISSPSNNSPIPADTHTGKYTHLTSSSTSSPSAPTIHCHLPPHAPLSFPTLHAYETHHTTQHTNQCSACSRNLPSAHLLTLHITENHDPITAVLRDDRGEKIYACFVEGCDKMCATPEKRRMHLVDKHWYPREYDFWIVNNGVVEGRRSLLREERGRGGRRHNAGIARAEGATDEGGGLLRREENGAAPKKDMEKTRLDMETDVGMEDITHSIAALQFVPHALRFGRRRQGGGLATS